MNTKVKIILGIIVLVSLLISVSYNIIPFSQYGQSYVQVPDTVPLLVSQSHVVGPAPSNIKITVMIIPLLKQEALAEYIQGLYTPGSPNYHKYLNARQIYQNFSVYPITQELVSYASLYGIKVNATNPLFPMLIGTIGQFENMFHVSFYMYRYNNMTYFAPSNDVELPSSIAPYVATILGLNNITIAQPDVMYLAEYKHVNGTLVPINRQELNVAPNQFIFPFPVYEYSPLQLEGAYDLLPLYNLGFYGQNETIGIVDAYGDPYINDSLNFFDSCVNLPNPPHFEVIYYNNASQYPPPSFGWGLESDLDVEYSHTMAPGANIILVYTPYPDNELFAAVAYLVEYHLANVISLSWGAPEIYLAEYGVNVSALDSIFEAAVAEGIQVFVASGDAGVYNSIMGIHSINYPASSPYVTSVGGTSLWMKGVSKNVGATMYYIKQVGWGDYFVNASGDGYSFKINYTFAGSTGGESIFFSKPFYQKGLSYVNRTNPDIALDADPYTGVNVYVSEQVGNFSFYIIYLGVGGTSLAAPLAAGIFAIIDQYYNNTLGFVNPYLYRLYFMSDKVPYKYSFLPTYSYVSETTAGLMFDFSPILLTGAEIYSVFGNDTGYFATPNKYNFVTGLGSINAYELLTLINTNGTALKLTGNGYAYSNSSVPMNGQLTVSFWIDVYSYPPGGTYYGIVGNMGITSPNKDSWGVLMSSNGQIYLELYNGTKYYLISSNAKIPLKRMTHVTITYNNQTGVIDFYFNSTLVRSVTGIKMPLNSYTVYIGNVLHQKYPFTLRELNGEIVNLQIYDSVLNSTQVSLLYLANIYGAPIANASVVSWILLEQTTGSIIYAQIGPNYSIEGGHIWAYLPAYLPAPQYLGVSSWIYNIYQPPSLI